MGFPLSDMYNLFTFIGVLPWCVVPNREPIRPEHCARYRVYYDA